MKEREEWCQMSMDDVARESGVTEDVRLESAYRRGAHQAIEMVRQHLEAIGYVNAEPFMADVAERLHTLRRSYTHNRKGSLRGFKERGPLMHMAIDYARQRHDRRIAAQAAKEGR